MSNVPTPDWVHAVKAWCDEAGHAVSLQQSPHGEWTAVVPVHAILPVCYRLRDHHSFQMLVDIAGVDYLHYGRGEWETDEATWAGFSRATHGMPPHEQAPHADTWAFLAAPEGSSAEADPPGAGEAAFPTRFAVVYHLLSIAQNARLRITVFVPGDPPVVDSVVPVWPSANWYEREAFDLFGILFKNHPDLRRLLTDYGFMGYPFRKDFPVSGHVEVRYDEDAKRVVYQPVSIPPRVLVPRVVRSDSRYAPTAQGSPQGSAKSGSGSGLDPESHQNKGKV